MTTDRELEDVEAEASRRERVIIAVFCVFLAAALLGRLLWSAP